MHPQVDMPAGLRRARRTAAAARASLAASGIAIALDQAHVMHQHTPTLVLAGFGIIFVTAIVQLLVPRGEWIKVEESVAPISAVLIVGLGAEQVTAEWLLWLVAVSCGVLARGGRAFWVGRALLLISLALPIVREQRVTLVYGCVVLAAIALLLVCGRVTQELRAMLDRARYDADHDGLTGALARAAFRGALDRAAVAAATGGGVDEPGGAVLLLDLDNFGAINKTAGHAAGDAVLRSLSEQLRQVLGEDTVLGRLGGDEFAAIVHGADAEPLATTLLAAISDEREDGHSLHASVGVALFPRDGDDADSLLRAVDVALRVAKRTGRSQVSVYAGDPISGRGPGGALDALERLIGGEGLEMHVQPIVSVPERVIHAYEALARFRLGGSSNPLHWFALADEFAVRDRLELACLQAGLAMLDDLPAGALLSVNLSGPLLLDARTTEILGNARHRDRLILEITENSLMEGTPGFLAEISRLIGEGIKFAVDDMGAGYSGLRQITTVRPNYIKLDRSLISGIDTDPDRGALVAAMLGYAHQTGGHLVAEGVETEAELETLLALGVDLIQGYLLGRPGAPWPAVTAKEPVALTPGPAVAIRPAATLGVGQL